MKSFIELFKKIGGKEFLRQCHQAHILIYTMFMALMLGLDKKSLEILRLVVQEKKLKKLRRKYKKFIAQNRNRQGENLNTGTKKVPKRKVWICWLQGMEHAPFVVKKCYESIKGNIKDREIVLITQDNYKDYVTFPNYINEKIEKGIISKTHMSDLLRLELLVKYGGTWIDATVFCSGTPETFYLDSDLFLFQNLKPGLDGKSISISNWFITASPNNKILRLTLDLLYEYWRTNNKLIDYFIFHDMFQLAIETYPDDWGKVIPISNEMPHVLQLRMFDEYDEKVWKSIEMQTPFHKLTYKYDEMQEAKGKTYFKMVFK